MGEPFGERAMATAITEPAKKTAASPALDFNARRLEQKLKKSIEGEVRFDAGSRALYATDASNYRQAPIGVIVPRTIQDIIATIEIAREFHVPVLGRGGGTSLAGQCCNVALVIDTTKYLHRVIDIDPVRRLARVQPGAVLDHLRRQTRKHGLTFGPDPATHDHCTLGGMIGNNSCGVHSVMAQFAGTGPRVSDNVEELEILTYDGARMRVGRTTDAALENLIQEGGRRGEIYAGLRKLRDTYAPLIRERYPRIPRRVSGYNLDELLPEKGFQVARALSGTESTCALFLEATLRLIEEPRARSLLVLGYPDVYSAADHILEVMEHRPIGLEGLDQELIEYNKRMNRHTEELELLPKGGGWLLVEFGGETKQAADDKARQLIAALQRSAHAPTIKLYDDPVAEAKVWEVRESGLGATAFVPGQPDSWAGWEDSAVPPERVGDYLRDLRRLFKKYDYAVSVYGHFGQGCVHCSIPFELTTRHGLEKYRAFVEEASDLVLSYGGSFSGEHGDGQSRGELLPKMFGPELIQAFREFKAIWDPRGMMNPGKVVDPYPILSNLRLGEHYDPPAPETYFQFRTEGSFSRAALRCVGIGKCRRTDGGTMCPSYMVTREEKHSTRGRAHLLFEMLQGDVIEQGWRDEHVKEALDLCLACKGCKGECPVNVDLATYKAEFLAHYYKGRLRPRSAYSMGLIYWTAQLASKFPALANFLTQTPPFGAAAKWLGGIAPERELPKFAQQTFRA